MTGEASGTAQPPIRAVEFFAGIGLVREALASAGVEVVWANDIEKAKRDAYAENHPADHFVLGDVRQVSAAQLPPNIELATSSFPCVDLSLAGNRLGLVGAQSGMFWEFARILEEMGAARPRALLLENVRGFASSHGGQDLTQALDRLSGLGYSSDVFTIDARHFVPQSRPRMFIVGILGELPKNAHLGVPPISDVRPEWVRIIHERHHQSLKMHYLDLPPLPTGPDDLARIVENIALVDDRWWTEAQVNAFVGSLSESQMSRLITMRDASKVSHRTAYRRTRNGVAVWELRRDSIAGCLRTTGGGSSRQALVEIGKGNVRVRWMTPFEYARLMGAPSYRLVSGTQNQQLFGFGDAVVVDVVRWIGRHYLVPTLRPHV